MYAPPNTAVHHQLHEGWLVGDHFAAWQLDELRWLHWAKTVNGQKNIKCPEPIEHPGTKPVVPQDETSPFTVTVEDYLRMSAEAEAAELAEQEEGG